MTPPDRVELFRRLLRIRRLEESLLDLFTRGQLFGTTENFGEVHDSFVSRGRFFSRLEVNRASKVVVLGRDIVDALFPYLDPLDKVITIDGRRGVVRRERT